MLFQETTLKLLSFSVFVTFVFCAAPVGAEPARTIIVMDGSGSMWGQIDGRAKLEIARDTVAEVLTTIPETQELGLMAYGHRVKGDCSDIELMVPPAKGTGPEISARVKAMKFLGKTPLSEAVRQAAEALRYGEEPATVVLVTDGLETCNADPCALGRELEASGLNFTAHVIGFGLTQAEGAQVACLAEETGGRYLPASDAKGLAEALAQTVRAEPAAPAKALPRASIEAVAEAEQGAIVEVSWTGTPEAQDTITLSATADGEPLSYEYVETGNPVRLQMPGVLGDYLLSYRNADQNVISTRSIKVVEAPVSMTAPEVVDAGAEVAVFWQGPDAEYDNIQLRRVGEDGYLTYDYTRDGNNPVHLTMPEEIGDYLLIYRLNDAMDLAERPIKVVAKGSAPPLPLEPALVPISLSAETGGQALAISWSAVPVAGQGLPPEAWAMPDEVTGPVEAEFLTGDYEVTGLAGDQVFAGRIRVSVEGPFEFTIPLAPALSPAAETTPALQDPQPWVAGQVCAARGDCALQDAATGLRVALPAGWVPAEPLFYTTAAGVVAERPSAEFTSPAGAMVALNPRQWAADLGPCVEIDAGQLCSDAKVGEADDFARIRDTLVWTPAKAAAADPDLLQKLQAKPLPAAEGVALPDLLTPPWAKE
jgi:Ca-activated chloride channel homolog